MHALKRNLRLENGAVSIAVTFAGLTHTVPCLNEFAALPAMSCNQETLRHHSGNASCALPRPGGRGMPGNAAAEASK
jgi:hypothetical protein